MCIPCIIAILLVLLAGSNLLFNRKKLRILGIIAIILAITASVYAVWRTRLCERNFPLVATGDSQSRVKELLGRPASITDGTKAEYGLPRSDSEIRKDVAAEFWYYCMYVPDVWVVSFDKDQKVVRKYQLSSP